ncbi:hypothetical protein LZC95_39785 [Pendulispora brunnea]|uniref:Uncharacterized protein n=1 Tax=Pendulispora brunnea TaxID=2905690 RepID=A0ABZ2K1G5_9BACT
MGTTEEGNASVREAKCSCDEGYIAERDGELACIAKTPRNEGYGYRFDREPNADTVSRELEALRGDWFRKSLFWTRVDKPNEVGTNGFHYDLPRSAGPAVWHARDFSAVQRGDVHITPPATQVVQIGTELTGALAGFRPMQFSKTETPDDGLPTILYKRSEESVTSGGETRVRPTLLVIECSDTFTSGLAKPRIESCASYASPISATTYVRDMFDPL